MLRGEPGARYLGLSLCIFLSGFAVAAPDDASLKKLLVGTWTSDPNDPGNDIERKADKLHLYGTVHYAADGTGITEIRKEGWCGPLIRRLEFRWDVKGGTLLSYLQQATLEDKIISLSDNRASFISADAGQGRENRVKVSGPDCAEK